MNFERRDFLCFGAAGLAGAIFSAESAYGQSAHKRESESADSIEFRGGSGSLQVELKLDNPRSPGTLELQLDNFRRGSFKSGFEKVLIMNGSFRATGGQTKRLHRSYFSIDEVQVFARLVDDRHSTSLMFTPTAEPNIDFLTVWNDTKPPETFRIDETKFKSREQKPEDYILDDRGKSLELKGLRTPPEISAEDLENSLDNHPDYLAFVRGKKYMRVHAALRSFACAFMVLMVPGGALFIADWEG